MARVVMIVMVALSLNAPALSNEGTHTLAQRLEEHVAFLASDSLAGRLVGTRGIETATNYITDHFVSTGLEPLFGDSYRQEFEIQFGREVVNTPKLEIGKLDLTYSREFEVVPISASGQAEGSVVVSLGVPSEPADLEGKILFSLCDPRVEAERWTMVGQDGLLNWMAEITADAHDRGAQAVVFVTRESQVHFPIRCQYDIADLCVVETSEKVFERIFGAIPPIEPGEAHEYPDRLCHIEVEVTTRKVKVANIGGLLRGKSEEYIVIGAHYDHLGYGEIASSTPWRREVHNGADDNASGVAVLLEAARLMAQNQKPDRSIAFLSFTAEELGAVGSEYFVKHPPFAIESVVAMINLDTVGRLEKGRLIVFGARSAREFETIIGEIDAEVPAELIQKEEIFGFSDQNPFYSRGIPSIHIFTGAYDDYHSPDDDWSNLNYEGMGLITSIVVDLASRLSSAETHITPVVMAEQPKPKGGGGRGAFLGIVPDFTYEGTGVGIKGTIPDSPARIAGLQPGDVIVSVDGQPIADLKGLMYALTSRKPGDEIEIKVMRASQALVKHAVLGIRSQRK